MPVDVEHVNIQMVMGNEHTFYFSKVVKVCGKGNTIISRFHCVLSFCHVVAITFLYDVYQISSSLCVIFSFLNFLNAVAPGIDRYCS
jgi:hypothetical protein